MYAFPAHGHAESKRNVVPSTLHLDCFSDNDIVDLLDTGDEDNSFSFAMGINQVEDHNKTEKVGSIPEWDFMNVPKNQLQLELPLFSTPTQETISQSIPTKRQQHILIIDCSETPKGSERLTKRLARAYKDKESATGTCESDVDVAFSREQSTKAVQKVDYSIIFLDIDQDMVGTEDGLLSATHAIASSNNFACALRSEGCKAHIVSMSGNTSVKHQRDILQTFDSSCIEEAVHKPIRNSDFVRLLEKFNASSTSTTTTFLDSGSNADDILESFTRAAKKQRSSLAMLNSPYLPSSCDFDDLFGQAASSGVLGPANISQSGPTSRVKVSSVNQSGQTTGGYVDSACVDHDFVQPKAKGNWPGKTDQASQSTPIPVTLLPYPTFSCSTGKLIKPSIEVDSTTPTTPNKMPRDQINSIQKTQGDTTESMSPGSKSKTRKLHYPHTLAFAQASPMKRMEWSVGPTSLV
jgi:hypothetical protein